MVQERLKAIKKQYGGKELGKVTVDMTIGGMRGITVAFSSAVLNKHKTRHRDMYWCLPAVQQDGISS